MSNFSNRQHQSIPTALYHRSSIPNLNRYAVLLPNTSNHAYISQRINQQISERQHFHHYLNSFPDSLSIYKYNPSHMKLLSWPRLRSHHVGPVSSLDIDNSAEGRFLLSGGADCTVSVYDLFPIFEDKDQKIQKPWSPISRSKRDIPNMSRRVDSTNNTIESNLPSGHSFSICSVQWYPVDNGIFISSDVNGRIILWDTNLFEPAFSFEIPNPNYSTMIHRSSFSTIRSNDNISSQKTLGISNMTIPKSSTSSHFLAAVASHQDPNIRLCDVTSGTYSHQLTGHGPFGVHTVSWSPKDEFLLVSGGDDGTIRLWDIRKSGSAACITILDREQFEIDDSCDSIHHQANTSQKRRRNMIVGPNNFSRVRGNVQSHGGAVLATEFSKDGQCLVSAGRDSRLRLWDFTYPKPLMLPTYFLGSSGLNGDGDTNMHSKKPFGDKVSISITEPGSKIKTSTLWCAGNESGEILGYELHGGGGRPKIILKGHLTAASALSVQERMMRLFTGSMDGMIMGWGCSLPEMSEPCNMNATNIEDEDTWDNLYQF